VPFELGIIVKSDIAIGIYNIFAENDITIPFPQVDLNVKKEDEDLIAGSDKNKLDSKKKSAEKKDTKKLVKKEENIKKLGPVEDQNHNDDK
jgi:small-conductance mechanosensitive channel